MAIIFDKQGNLVDTENRIQFGNENFDSEPYQYTPNYLGANSPMLNSGGNTRPNSFTFDNDPAFGFVSSYKTGDTSYPQTDILPFYNINEFDADELIPNIQRALGNPRFDLTPTGIMQQAPSNTNRFQGVSDMSLIDETTNDEQDQEYIDQVDQSNNKFGGLMDLIGNIAIPGYGFFKNMAKGGLEGLRGFGRRLGQSDFAQSPTLVDYLDARSYGGRDARDRAASQNMREARAIQTQVDRRGDSTSRVSDRNRSSVTTSSAARSKGVGGGGYTASDSNRESYRGR